MREGKGDFATHVTSFRMLIFKDAVEHFRIHRTFSCLLKKRSTELTGALISTTDQGCYTRS